jgi:hypothetical protein
MTGDTIRININGTEYIRTVLTADTSMITFNKIEDLDYGATFNIGAVRFRVRYAPVMGTLKNSIKTVEGLTVVARRLNGADTGSLTCRMFVNCGDTPVHETTVDIFNPDDPNRTSIQRAVPLEGQGTSLELELEMLTAYSGFTLESVELKVREEVSTEYDTVKE